MLFGGYLDLVTGAMLAAGKDLAAATAKGIPVLRAPGRNADGVAELTVGLLLAVTRHILPADRDVRAGEVFVPFHWVGANRLTNDALDPSSRMPEFKVCAAEVTA